MNDEPRETIDTERMLLDFVSGRDVDCPLCGYNLRDLTKTTCPECEHSLEMRVGLQKMRLLPFILAIAPGMFSGVCAAFLGVIFIANYIGNGGKLVGIGWPFVCLDLFGWFSGILTCSIILRRNKFLAQPIANQRIFAAAIWTMHIMAFIVVLIIAVG